MNRHKIDIKAGRLFPWHFLLLAVVTLVLGLALIQERTLLSIILLIVSAFILSGYSGTEIDKNRQTYREYTSFCFVKTGSKVPYTGIEKIFINSSRKKQKMYSAHTTQSSVFTHTEYNGYLKLDQGTKIHLLSKPGKTTVTEAMKKVSVFLNVQLEDQTANGGGGS